MSLVTYSKVKTYVQNRLDLRDESFITSAEMLEYCEEALRYCEAEVHKLNIADCYFEAESYLQLDTIKKSYSLPSNIYGNKILRLVYSDGSKEYDIKRLTGNHRHVMSSSVDRYGTDSEYGYRLINNSPNTGTKIRLYPIPNETSATASFTADTTDGSETISNISGSPVVGDFITGSGMREGTRLEAISGTTGYLSQAASATGSTVSLVSVSDKVTIHYIRRVDIPTATTDYIDFPEFWNFIAQHMVVACLKKELGNPRLATEQNYLEELRQQMHSTLSEMVVDGENGLEMDFGHYNDSDTGYVGGY